MELGKNLKYLHSIATITKLYHGVPSTGKMGPAKLHYQRPCGTILIPMMSLSKPIHRKLLLILRAIFRQRIVMYSMKTLLIEELKKLKIISIY